MWNNRVFITVISSFLLAAGTSCLFAQDYSHMEAEEPELKADTTSAGHISSPAFFRPVYPTLMNPFIFKAPGVFETPAQRAARINAATRSNVLGSVGHSLYWNRFPQMSTGWTCALFVMSFFLSNPFRAPDGYVALDPSFTLVYMKTPGMAPYENPYTSDLFPKCIETEYDSSTGTYRQVMVDWSTYMNRISSINLRMSDRPVPKMKDNPIDRYIH